ncbi:hypothetical protein DRH29_04295, partial [candidate division Kazan bacterium]
IVFDNDNILTVDDDGPADFDTIQEAIDAATPGDTVLVKEGTYKEDLLIDKAIDLTGEDKSSTMIKGISTVDAKNFPAAVPNVEVLADGAKIHNFTIQSPDYTSGYYSSGIVIGASNVEIYDNNFLTNAVGTTDDISQTIQTYSESALPGVDVSGLYIHGNSFAHQGNGNWGYEGIYINPSAATGIVSVSDNEFTGKVLRAITSERSKTTITGNIIITDQAPSDLTVEGSYQGINVRNIAGDSQSDIVISGNTVGGTAPENGFYEGIRIGLNDSQVLSGFKVNGNTVQYNNTGVSVRSANGVALSDKNVFLGNNTAVSNDSTVQLDAVENYWGTAVRDTIENEFISGDVNFEPYYVDEEMTILSDEPVSEAKVDDDWKDGDAMPNGFYFGYNAFDVIQDGVDAVESGGAVDVKEGTYNGSVLVNKAVTLTGAGVGTSTINGAIQLGADNINLSGFTVDGPADLPGQSKVGVYVLGGTSGHNISELELLGNSPAETDGSRGILFGYNTSNVSLDNLDISGWHSGAYVNPSSNIELSKSSFHDNVVGFGSDGLTDVVIKGSEFTNNAAEAVGYSDIDDVGTGLSLRYNKIYGNAEGVNWYSGDNIDALKNYWGDASGPDEDGVGYADGIWDGIGDTASENVDYNPFCVDEPVSENEEWTCNLGSSGPLDELAVVVSDKDESKDGIQVYINDDNELAVEARDADGYPLVNYDRKVQLSADGGASFGDSLLGDNSGEWSSGKAPTTITNDSMGDVNVTAVELESNATGAQRIEFVHPDGVVIDDIVSVNSFAQANGTFEDGMHFLYRITVYDMSETDMSVKFSDWIKSDDSGSTIPVDGNTRLLIDESGGTGGVIGGYTEDVIVNGSGSLKSYELGNEYSDQSPSKIDISGIDLAGRMGRQVEFRVFFRVPEDTESGFYTTEYGIKTE